MNTDLLSFVLARLKTREPAWTEVARDSGVPYDTLKKIATGVTGNPGVLHVQRLAEYFQASAPAVAPAGEAHADKDAATQSEGRAAPPIERADRPHSDEPPERDSGWGQLGGLRETDHTDLPTPINGNGPEAREAVAAISLLEGNAPRREGQG